ncbi:peptide chain release factor 3 [Zhihengliuella halotolerans]|uniref:peptide chain release factor 3 n=1 Tax=Zhihengliuella halotolerans TaxID=370736 RepID=UPI001CA4AFA2|nr:peptide chain release factor 3 [Zhihengliuella halotolerans]
MLHTESPAGGDPGPTSEIARRRTFAVISHPDAGKSTLTEAMALQARVVDEAGVTHGKASRQSTVSDWNDVERERGISISSSVLRFDFAGKVVNLLDTPGHSDFSEDTYRVLMAVDFTVMLIDAAKGMEPQTRKLFDACRRLSLPVITVINKCDRPGKEPLELFDEIQEATGRTPVAVNWPVGLPSAFQGLTTPGEDTYTWHEATQSGARVAREEVVAGASDERLEPGAWSAASENALLARELNGAFDDEGFAGCEQTPVFFTAASSNLGVRAVMDFIAAHAPAPSPRTAVAGHARELTSDFSGYVFKVQSGMNPAHRDQIAIVRVNSGTFERGMDIRHAQSGRPLNSKYAHHLVGRGRETAGLSWPGDIVGFVNVTGLKIGDTMHSGKRVEFPPMPRFNPERFRVIRLTDSSQQKRFAKGIAQLEEDGTVQVFRTPDGSPRGPVLGAVGDLQFEVVKERLRREFGVETAYDELLPYEISRPLKGPNVESLKEVFGTGLLYRPDGEVIGVFRDKWKLERALERLPELFAA